MKKSAKAFEFDGFVRSAKSSELARHLHPGHVVVAGLALTESNVSAYTLSCSSILVAYGDSPQPAVRTLAEFADHSSPLPCLGNWGSALPLRTARCSGILRGFVIDFEIALLLAAPTWTAEGAEALRVQLLAVGAVLRNRGSWRRTRNSPGYSFGHPRREPGFP